MDAAAVFKLKNGLLNLQEMLYDDDDCLLDLQAIYNETLSDYQRLIKKNTPKDKLKPTKISYINAKTLLCEKLNAARSLAHDLKQLTNNESDLKAIRDLMDAMPFYPEDLPGDDSEISKSSSDSDIAEISESYDENADISLNQSIKDFIMEVEEITLLVEEYKRQEDDIRIQEIEKEEHKPKMFEAKDEGDLEQLELEQEFQKFFYDNIKEAKEHLMGIGKDIRDKIVQILPKCENVDQRKYLEEVLKKVTQPISMPSPPRAQTAQTRVDDDIIVIDDDDVAAIEDQYEPQRIEESITEERNQSRRKSFLPKWTPQWQHVQQPIQNIISVPQPGPSTSRPSSRLKKRSSLPQLAKVPSLAKIHPFLGGKKSTLKRSQVPLIPFKSFHPETINQTSTEVRPVDKNLVGFIEDVFKKSIDEQKAHARRISVDQRENEEKKHVRVFINGIIEHPTIFKQFEEGTSHVEKLNSMQIALMEIFEAIEVIMTFYREPTFKFSKTDDDVIFGFMREILVKLNSVSNYDGFRNLLHTAFTKFPYPKFQAKQQSQIPTSLARSPKPESRIPRTPIPRSSPSGFRAGTRPTSTPINQSIKPKMILPSRTASMTRPRAASRLSSGVRNNSTPFQERMSSIGTTPVKSKVQKQVRDLSNRSLQKSISEPSTKQRLEIFLKSFCKIFIMNQKNRKAPFKVWLGTFHKNINPILTDLDLFYKSLPFKEFKQFSRKSLEMSLAKLLKFVYLETKDQDLSSVQCKSLIGDEMNKLIECKHLKDLSSAMGIFVEGAKELLMPHLKRMDQARMGSTSAGPSRMLSSRDRSRSRGMSARANFVQKSPPKTLTPQERADQSYLNRRGNGNAQLKTPIWKFLKSSELWEQLKRIIGTPKELDDIGPNYNLNKALSIMLEHSVRIDETLKRLLTIRRGDYHNALEIALDDFRLQIIYMIYGDDVETYFSEIQEVNNRMNQFDIEDLIRNLGFRVFKSEDVKLMIKDPFNFVADDEIAENMIRFIKDLRIFQSKYIWEVLHERIHGEIDMFLTAPLEFHLRAPRRHEDEDDDNIRMRINHPVVLHKNEKGIGRIPDNIIERDILYVACQLTNRDDDSGESKLDKIIIEIAKKFQTKELTERTAVRAISGIIDSIPCIPYDFYDKYFYHKNNIYFEQVYFQDADYNLAVRSDMMRDKNKARCVKEEKNEHSRYMKVMIDPDLARFMQNYNNIDEYIETLEYDHTYLNATCISMLGAEMANNGNRALGIPSSVDSSGLTEGKIFDIRVNFQGGEQTESVRATLNPVIEKLLAESAQLIGLQMNEPDHLNNSILSKRAIIYELQPTALRRKNFWQARGSELPQWFPGVFTVFPDSLFSKPAKSILSMNELMTHAWRTMAPKLRGG